MAPRNTTGLSERTRTTMKLNRRTGVEVPTEVKFWRARYRGPDGEQQEKTFATWGEAKRWRDDAIAAMATGQWVDPRAGRLSVAEYARGWEANLVAGASQLSIVDNALRLHILPALGRRPMSSLLRSEVQGMVKRLSEELAPGSVRNIYEVLLRMMAAAVDDRLIPSSPCVRISLPRDPDVEAVPATLDQITWMADSITPQYRSAVLVLAGSGLRIGELLGLKVADVDFLRRTLRVERQRLQNGRIGPPKTESSRRTVALAPWVVDELSEHLAAHPAAPGGWLFTNTRREALTYNAWRSAWKPARERCACGHGPGGHDDDGCRKADCGCGSYAPPAAEVDTHGLRHAFASALISGGASVKQVQLALGHSSAAITLRVYTHQWPGDEDRTRAIIDSVFGLLRAQ